MPYEVNFHQEVERTLGSYRMIVIGLLKIG